MESSDGFSKFTGGVISLRIKNSFEIKYLLQLVMKLKGGIYFTYCVKNIIKWTVLRYDAEYFYSIMICLIKDTNGTQDNIIAIVQEWIFDSNLCFVLPLNKKHLGWCYGATKNHTIFVGFCEIVQVCEGVRKKR